MMELRKSGSVISGLMLAILLFIIPISQGVDRLQVPVPDEQRLYQQLMSNYESSVRPVINASTVINIRFKLTLNQIVDLEERTQVLTTNVFIDQEWTDENLQWDPDEYNGIKTLRVPAAYVWLPDTFIFNNADDGSTGFMQGVYVLLNFNGTVLWPVPVKLKSSCKVDIAYFPFDDQECILRFGSWIYSGEWMNFESSVESVDLRYYIDNSEWDLVGMRFDKGFRQYSEEMHPDLTYTLHIRRRTFYYIFNIIVPCIMLSVLTLLTFWLPTTSGEKISLGLSVFLAFSMFMLLIAEEVPATSESVPLIGIYLTTVMTLTSLSVVMAVMVINLYNRGSKASRAPYFVKKLVLCWMCKLLRMTNDLELLAKTIKLNESEEARYNCTVHHRPKNGMKSRRGSKSVTPRSSLTPSPEPAHNTLNPPPLNGGGGYEGVINNRGGFEGGNGSRHPDIQRDFLHPGPGPGLGFDDSLLADNNGAVGLDYRNRACTEAVLHHRRGGVNRGQQRGEYSDTNPNSDFLTPSFNGNSTTTNMMESAVNRLSLLPQSYDEPPRQQQPQQSIDAKFAHNNNSQLKNNHAYNQISYSVNKPSLPKWQPPPQMPVTVLGGAGHFTGHYVAAQPQRAAELRDENEDYDDEDDGPVWQRRDSVLQREKQALVVNRIRDDDHQPDSNPVPKQSTSRFKKSFRRKPKNSLKDKAKKSAISEDLRQCARNEPGLEFFLNCGRHDILAGLVSSACRKEKALAERRAVIVEWQTIATVIDRLLFWIFLIGTLAGYFIILFAMPATKPLMRDDIEPFHVLKNMHQGPLPNTINIT